MFRRPRAAKPDTESGSASKLVLERPEALAQAERMSLHSSGVRNAAPRQTGWRPTDWRAFLRLRFGSKQPKDAIYWVYRGELVQLNTGRLIALVEGLETSRLVDGAQSPLVASARLDSSKQTGSPASSQTALCRKLFTFRPTRGIRSLSSSKDIWPKLADTAKNTAVKWCRDHDAFVLAYPYQVLTFVREVDGSLTWVAEQGDSSGSARQLVAKLDYRPQSAWYGLRRSERTDHGSKTSPGPSPDNGESSGQETELRFPVHVGTLSRGRPQWSRGAFELYTFREMERPRSARFPGARWWNLPLHLTQSMARKQRSSPSLQSGGDARDNEPDSMVTMELTKIGDCPSWTGLGIQSKCLLLLRGRRLDREPDAHTGLSSFFQRLLERNPLYREPPVDLVEIGMLQEQRHGQAIASRHQGRRGKQKSGREHQ